MVGNLKIGFDFKNNEVIIHGEESNSLGITKWTSITPINSNWSLLSGFSSQLSIKKIQYK